MRQRTDQNVLAAIVLFILLASCGTCPQTGGETGGTGHNATATPATGVATFGIS